MRLRIACLLLTLLLWPLSPAPGQDEDDVLAARIEELCARLLEGSPAVRLAAERELSELGPDALPLISRQLERHQAATAALHRIADRLGADLPRPAGSEGHWVSEKYRLAQERFQQGDYLAALKLVEAILTIEPQPALRSQLIELRRRSRQMLLQEYLVSARLEPTRRVMAPGETLLVRLKLRNNSEQPITIARGPDEGWQFGTVIVQYEAFTPDGEWVSRQFTRPIDLNGDVKLQSGEEWERLLSLEIDTTMPEGVVVLQRITVSGTLRPHQLAPDQGAAIGEFLPLLPERLWVAAPEAHALLERPLEVVRKELSALETPDTYDLSSAQYRRLFYAALALPEAEEEGFIEAVIGALPRLKPSAAKRLMRLLSQLTRRFPDMEVKTWVDWWQSRR